MATLLAFMTLHRGCIRANRLSRQVRNVGSSVEVRHDILSRDGNDRDVEQDTKCRRRSANHLQSAFFRRIAAWAFWRLGVALYFPFY